MKKDAKKLSKKCYLIHLAGQGDTEIKIVNKATWDWIVGEGEAPPHQVESYIKSCRKYGSGYTPIPTTAEASEYLKFANSGSCDNDKALECEADFKRFASIKSAMQYISKHGLKVVDEYEGCLY